MSIYREFRHKNQEVSLKGLWVNKQIFEIAHIETYILYSQLWFSLPLSNSVTYYMESIVQNLAVRFPGLCIIRINE